MLGGYKSVQQRLDRLAWASRLKHCVRQVIDHFFVAHRVTLVQRINVVHAQRGEIFGLHGQHIRAGRLNIEHARLASHEIFFDDLGAGVAAIDVHHRAITA